MIFTLGHSNHPFARVLELLAGAEITAIADVRSAPVSRWSPHFNKDALSASLARNGIVYAYLGNELGGRPKDLSLQNKGKPDYRAMERTQSFRAGIARLLEGAKEHRIALMCAEKDPVDCHRFLLIARHLVERGVPVAHILADGGIEDHRQTEARFTARKGGADLFGD